MATQRRQRNTRPAHAAAAPGVAGARWYELRRVGETYTVHQQGTVAPGDGVHRWMGSIAMDGARIGAGAMLAAGALLGPGKALPPRELWAGRPARPMRMIPDDEFERMGRQAALYCELAQTHRAIFE